MILEVGLGGRLDAVNLLDADCAIVTSVAMDHMDYLGDNREAIGFEKAGIFRPGRPAIIGDPLPPESLLRHASEVGADLQVSGRDFGFSGDRTQWAFWGRNGLKRGGLAYPMRCVAPINSSMPPRHWRHSTPSSHSCRCRCRLFARA